MEACSVACAARRSSPPPGTAYTHRSVDNPHHTSCAQPRSDPPCARTRRAIQKSVVSPLTRAAPPQEVALATASCQGSCATSRVNLFFVFFRDRMRQLAHLEDRDHGQHADEQEQERDEQPDCADVG